MKEMNLWSGCLRRDDEVVGFLSYYQKMDIIDRKSHAVKEGGLDANN